MRRVRPLVVVLLALAVTAVGSSVIRNPVSVSVTPDGTWDPDRAQNSGPWTTDFTVTNTGTSSTTFYFDCTSTGGVSCSGVSPTSKKLNPSASWTVTATYSVGTSGGELRVSAEGSGAYDEGLKNISTPPNLTLVLPVAAGSAATVRSRTPVVRATYFSNDAPIDSASLFVQWGTDTVTAFTRRNARLVEWEVDTTRQLSPGGAKDLTIRICNTNNGCSTRTWTVTADGSGAPLISFRGMPFEALGRQFSAPFGPGLAVSGAEVETGFSVPAYRSMGVARSTGFAYSTRQAYPRALVNADIELTWPSGTPDEVKAVLLDGAVRMDSLVVASPSCNATSQPRCRVTLQGDFSSGSWTGALRKWLKVEVRVTSGGDSRTNVDSVEVVLADRRTTLYGAGWYPSSLLEVSTAGSDAILLGPTGSASIYRGFQGQYLSPPGNGSVLVKTGATWELRFRGGGKLVFDTTTGRLASAVDRHSNTTSYTFDGSGRIAVITDPVNRKFFFTYAGSLDGANYVIEVVDSLVGNSSRRRSRITFNGSRQLVYDSLASDPGSAATTTYGYTTYGGGYTNVLTTRTDAAGSTTTVSYDARRRPTQVTLPQVADETGSAASPVIAYRAQELRGLDTLLLDSAIAVRLADPRGNWTRSRLNRWGAAERTWDALGTLARAAYLPDGRVAWSEGPVADSTRVWFRYDVLGRMTGSYRLRATADTVWMDRLEYGAYDLVMRRTNALGRQDSMWYNAAGDLTHHFSPTGDLTRYYWRSDGLLDSLNPPGPSGTTRYTYDGTLKNLSVVTNPAGLALTTNTLDGFGRVTDARRKMLVRAHEPADTVQWRRTLTAYSPLNQVDSVRTERSTDCAQPCLSPSWPSAADTLQWQQVRTLRDRLGRDTARVRTNGVRTRYVYDALGRLLARWPFAESTAVVDSFRYDVAGRLRAQWTRRGVRIVHVYDSRGRGTADSVPGLGTFLRTFGGPNGELTVDSIAGYVDSIGGAQLVDRYGYSQAGLLLADTARVHATVAPAVTRVTYDRYGRDSVIVDPTGTWQLRYDGVRGILDTVRTPFSDTLVFTVDSLWRPLSLQVQGAGNPLTATLTYDTVGVMTTRATTHGSSAGTWSDSLHDPDPAVRLWPQWTETRSGQAQAVEQDTLEHNGWGWVTQAWYLRGDTVVDSESMRFSAEGNLRVNLDTRTYDGTTQRLTARSGGSLSYDRAGNLVSWSVGGHTWTYTYDPLDRLIAARYDNAVVARYAYDLRGRRIVKRVYSAGPYSATVAFTRFAYRGAHVIAEADSAGALTLGYTWGLATDDLVAIHRYADTSDYLVTQDHLHSVRMITQRNGTWVASWRYRIYGAVLDSAGSVPFELRYRWTGREWDRELGWYFFRSRSYDPAVGRFVQEDAIGWAGGPNLYAYGDGNPTNGRDPDGLSKDFDSSGPSPRAQEAWWCSSSTNGCSGEAGGLETTWFDWAEELGADVFDAATNDICVGSTTQCLIKQGADAGKSVTAQDIVNRAADFSAGFGDAATPFGLTEKAREAAGWDNVNASSSAYAAGRRTYQAVEITSLAAGGLYLARDLPLFARHTGMLNTNDYVRLGWGWNGPRVREVFRLAVGNPRGPIHWHLDIW